jgi:hypothetical protein
MVIRLLKKIWRRLPPHIKGISAANDPSIANIDGFDGEVFTMPAQKDTSGTLWANMAGYHAQVPRCSTLIIKNGKCIVGQEEVFTESNSVIQEMTSQTQNPMLRWPVSRLRKPTYFKGSLLNLSLSGLENNYYHFCVELIGRWYIYYLANVQIDRILYSMASRFQREFLGILGFYEGQVIELEQGKAVQGDIIVYPFLINNWRYVAYRGHVYHQKVWLPSWITGAYKEIFRLSKVALDGTKRRIYISRSKASYRKVLNEDEVMVLLAKYRFDSHCMEDLTVRTQMQLFSQAEMIIGPHGAGLINMSWCQNSVTICELFSESYHDSSFRLQATVLGHDYHYIVCKTPDTHDIPPQQEDMIVDLRTLEEWLGDYV